MHVNRQMGNWFSHGGRLKCVRDQRINWQRGHESGWLAFPQTDGRRETYPSEQLLYPSVSCLVGCNWLLLSFLSFASERNSSGACCVVHSARDDSHLVVNKTHTFPTPSSDTHELSAHHFLFLYGKMPFFSLSLSLSLSVCSPFTPLSLVTQPPYYASQLCGPLSDFSVCRNY